MGNIFSDMDSQDVLLALVAAGVSGYTGFYVYRDYKKKGI
jgi:hypothetical protein